LLIIQILFVAVKYTRDLRLIRQVTAWKALFINKGVVKRIIGLGKDESAAVLAYLNVRPIVV